MEDESGLELSLGLSCGGPSSKSKFKDATSDPKGDEESTSRVMGNNMTVSDDSFKNFFKSGVENQESKGKHKSDFNTQPQENFFTDLAKCSAPIADCPNDAHKNLSQFTRYQELLLGNKTIENDEEKSGSTKRKLPFEEINFQNKHEKLIDYVDIHGAKKTSGAPLLRDSHVSNTTEDGSTGENEDVAESEAPQSWLPSQREENAKCSDTFKFNGQSALNESSGIGSKGLSEPCLSGKEINPEYGKSKFGIPLSLQPLKVMNIPCPVPGTVPSTSIGSNASGFPSVMKLLPIANGERSVAPIENTNTMQLAFGYPSSQLPTLEKVSSSVFNSQPLHLSPFTSREHSSGAQNQEHFEDGARTSQDLAIATTKYAGETGTSARSEEGKLRNYAMKANEAMNKPGTEGFPREGPAIRPGIAPNLRFGGCGSYPDLPWVSATGQGPNGKTISGVTYKYNENQIKIVCACHGTHMSPDEFVQHASAKTVNSENSPNLASFPTSNTTNSAQS